MNVMNKSIINFTKKKYTEECEILQSESLYEGGKQKTKKTRMNRSRMFTTDDH